MQNYAYLFTCKGCRRTLTEHVVSPEPLTGEQLERIEFELLCPKCRWSAKRTGREAEQIFSTLKPTPVCG